MGLNESTIPIEQVQVGDMPVRYSWFGLVEHRSKVIDIDEERRYAMVSDENSDALYIMQLFRDGYASKPGQRVPASCSCSA